MWLVFINGAAVSFVKKPDGTLVVGVRITLKPGRDDELIALVLGARKLAPAIREAMRSGVVKGTYTQMEFDVGDLAGVGIEL
jgi:hypothetical protein